MFPKAHLNFTRCLTLSEWSHHLGYLGHFLYSSSMYYCHLFLASSAFVRSVPFLSFIVPIFAWNVPLVSPIFMMRFLLALYQVLSLECICQFHCIIIRDLIYVRPEWSIGFPYFLEFKFEFCIKKFVIWVTVSSLSYFCWLYRASPHLAAKNIINLISVLIIWWCPCVESSLLLLEEGVCYDQCILLAKLY